MKARFNFLAALLFLVMIAALGSAAPVIAAPAQQDDPTATPRPSPTPRGATAAELVLYTNAARMAYGHGALTVNSIIMASAQWTAETMAAQQMGDHIGGVADRLMAAGYGDGIRVWATENVANGPAMSAYEIVNGMWGDDTHQIPVKNPIYCDIGAGVATDSDGQVYYVLQAAYTDKRYCGPYIAPDGSRLPWEWSPTPKQRPTPTGPTPTGPTPTGPTETQDMSGVSPWIMPVRTVTPNAQGVIVHVVQPGQSLWSIAIAYRTKIKDIQTLNGWPSDWMTVYTGQKLKIPVTFTVVPATVSPPDTGTPEISTPEETVTVRPTGVTSSLLADTVLPPAAAGGSDAFSQFLKGAILGTIGVGLVLILFGVLRKGARV